MRSVNKVTGLGHRIVEALVESLGFRQIGVIQEEYAVSKDGMKMFGVLDLEPLLIHGMPIRHRHVIPRNGVSRPTGSPPACRPLARALRRFTQLRSDIACCRQRQCAP